MAMFLTPDEIQELTGKIKPAAQIRALRAMGIHHHVRPDGKPVVLAVDLSLGAPETTHKQKFTIYP